MNTQLIPALDAAPLPGPGWLFQVLLVLTFILHLLFLNLTLGGTLLAAVSQLLAGGRADDPRTVVARRLMGINTYAISMTITTGVAPLLFIQVLLQQYFYTATILIGWAWFLLLLVLTVGYYAVYVYKFRGIPARGEGSTWWLVAAAVAFLVIAMVQVAVNLIHAQPDKWTAVAANPWSVLGDPAYFPRLIHFVLAALAFSALVCTWWAVRQARRGAEVELNTGIAAFCWRWALWTTAVTLVDGFVMLLVLPRGVVSGLMSGGFATLGPLAVAIVLAIGLLMMLAKVGDPVSAAGTVNGTLATVVLVVVVMAITRHQVRLLYLDPVRSQFELQTAPQWGNFVLFAVLLVAGLATVAYMVRRVLTSPATGEGAA